MKITKKDKTAAENLIAKMTPIQGEKRTVEKCGDCGHLFGRRYIPYGLGHGITLDPCLCQITGHRPSTTVLESTP